MTKQFQHYTPSDFDKFDCVKISKVFYFALIYLLRAYLVWLMSVTNMQDREGILQVLYPEPQLFYLNLLSGMPGLFLLVVLSLRRPEPPNWVARFWPKSRVLLLSALSFDLMISFYGYLALDLISDMLILLQVICAITIAYFCFKSERLAINLSEFPEPMPEK